MTERMKEYRKRQVEKGLVQVRLWVTKEDEEFFKFMSKMVNPNKQNEVEQKRFGRFITTLCSIRNGHPPSLARTGGQKYPSRNGQ